MTEQWTFQPGSPESRALLQWHRSLLPQVTEEGKRVKGDTAGRAELRRARSPFDVALVPAYHRLLDALEVSSHRDREILAVIAGLAAHVKTHQADATFATQMGQPKEGKSSAPLHELRFRRLLACETREALYQHLIRVLRLLDGRANLASLAYDLYWWEHPNRRTRKQWAYEYYKVAPKAA